MATSERESSAQADGENGAATKRKSMDEIEVDLALPEPPSKRARRALKKGKSLPLKSGNADDKDDDEDTDGEDSGDKKNKDKKDKKRSEHGVWIGNLPFTIQATELKQWLVDNSGGVITDESITRIKIPTLKEPGRDKTQKPSNKGFAYIDFNDVGPKVAAIALSETTLGQRNLLIKDSKSFQGRPAKEKEPEAVENGLDKQSNKNKKEVDPNASRKIFVGNMSFKTTEDDVRRNFEKCGEIDWVKVATFEDTGKCKGYGWVKFREPDAAAWAVKGFVKVKEAVETEEDFQEGKDEDDEGDNSDASDDDNGNGKKKGQQPKQFKTRKWWVNRMLGRELKLELAEDDQARYKKRFGKDAPKRQGDAGDGGDAVSGDRNRYSKGRSSRPHDGGEAAGDGSSRDKSRDKRASRPLKEASDIQVARLTGAVVKHTGTKISFD
ncbi:hypothetical protein E4U17_007283 [Claviceps sp. LM77 group G4]|nr:hypothetical protein E4U17_007283 [Claviceps sp. LM77 group G4]KAG6080181.1 hypothetical protein E4U16_000535 [Claviceps sp. LM84 group G4]KAG6080442.1 hypothetical protein E4U33_007618 [Claviceps sp. LM78 group G4]